MTLACVTGCLRELLRRLGHEAQEADRNKETKKQADNQNHITELVQEGPG